MSSNDLARTLGEFAVHMRSLTTTEDLSAAIVGSAVGIVPGTRWAGVSVVSRRAVRPEKATDDVAARVDELQTACGEGPALSALRDRRTVYVADLSANPQWPTFAARVAELGVRSMVVYRLFVTDHVLGVLSLYSDQVDGFTAEAQSIGEILAQHAAVAMAGANAEEQLQGAVASRDLIGQAKGILMHRDRLTGLQAFAALTRASQETNVKLVEVARTFVSDYEASLSRA